MAKTVGLLAGVVVAAAACTLFDKPVVLTPDLPTCSTSDVACIQAHLSIEDSNQNVIPLTTIAAGTIQASQIAPGKGVPTVTDYYSTTLTFEYWEECLLATLTFTDPNGSRIAGCFTVRPQTEVRGSFGSQPMVAMPSAPDGQTTGTFSIWICPAFDPIDGTATFAIDMFPIAPVTPGQEAVSELLGGGQVAVGNPLSFEVEVPPGSSGTGSSSGGSGSSSGSSGCAAGDLLVSTLSCTPLGTNGTSPDCLSASEYTSATGQPLPAACAPTGTTGCIGTSGALVAPCCPGLTCRDSATCGDSSNAAGGACLP
jgi:hypothetical protein